MEDHQVIEEAKSISSKVDYILLDSGRPNAAVKELGGTGKDMFHLMKFIVLLLCCC